MWSEHCSYKSSKVHLKRLPDRGKLVVQGPGENAGVVDIGDGLVAAFKIESHNHPSYVEPFQGADHRRRRNPARHFHDGRAADRGARFSALRPDHCRAVGATMRTEEPLLTIAASWTAWSAASRNYGNCFWRADRRRRSDIRAVLFAKPTGQCAGARHCAQKRRFFFAQGAAAPAIP